MFMYVFLCAPHSVHAPNSLECLHGPSSLLAAPARRSRRPLVLEAETRRRLPSDAGH